MRHSRAGLRTFGLDVGRVTFAPPQIDGWAQLCIVTSGSLQAHTGERSWIVADARGLWIPQSERYVLESRRACCLRILYVPARDGRDLAAGVTGVDVGSLLRALIDTASALGYLDRSIPYHDKIAALIDEELGRLAPARTSEPPSLPAGETFSRDTMRSLLRDVERTPSIGAIAAALGISPRTLERRCRRETGTSPRQWIRRAKIAAAKLALEGGANVTEAGLASGYASTSAFIAAFRAETGATPGAYGAASRLRPS